MVTITKNNGCFIFEVNGLHKLWSLKSQLTIPQEHIINVHQDVESITGWRGWRAPGTFFPGVITAGTFYKDGNKIFWDASDINKCIIINTKDEDYQELIIEVENPEAAIKLFYHQ